MQYLHTNALLAVFVGVKLYTKRPKTITRGTTKTSAYLAAKAGGLRRRSVLSTLVPLAQKCFASTVQWRTCKKSCDDKGTFSNCVKNIAKVNCNKILLLLSTTDRTKFFQALKNKAFQSHCVVRIQPTKPPTTPPMATPASLLPSQSPSIMPSAFPSTSPSNHPSARPTQSPSHSPSNYPSLVSTWRLSFPLRVSFIIWLLTSVLSLQAEDLRRLRRRSQPWARLNLPQKRQRKSQQRLRHLLLS